MKPDLPRSAVLLAKGREVELAERLLDQPLLVLGAERLAGHLLGCEDRQVRDLVADLLDRPSCLGFDVAPRLPEQLLALPTRCLERLPLVLLGRPPCTRDDLVGLGARLLQAV